MRNARPRCTEAFTLVELLTSVAIMTLLLIVVYGILQQTSKVWVMAESRAETFQAARLAMEMITRDLEGANIGTNNLAPPTRITFLTREDANGSPHASGNANILDTSPNDQIFFVGTAGDTMSQSAIDLTEYGYFVAFTTADAWTMKGPGYYLIRHQADNGSSGFDIFSLPTTWYTTPSAGLQNKLPIADHVIRFELQYEKSGGIGPQGTCILDDWNAALGSCTAGSIDTLPRAVHVTIAVLDRRAAGRFYAIVGTSGLPSTELAKIPDSIDTMTNAPVRSILRESLRPFFRTVYLKNAS